MLDEAIDEVVLVNFQIADLRVGIADIIGLKRKPAKELKVR